MKHLYQPNSDLVATEIDLVNPIWYTINMTVTDYIDGMTLYKYLENKTHYSDPYIVPIFFQLLWGIQILQHHGIQHNDMHSGNVFIVEEPQLKLPRQYTTVDGNIFILPSNAPQVLLFDWDFANTTENTGPKATDPFYCQNYGICEPLNERRDIYRCFRSLVDKLFRNSNNYSQTTQTFLKSILNGPIGTQRLDYISDAAGNRVTSYPCNVRPGHPKECIPYKQDEPKEIRSTQDLLQSTIFKKFESTAPVPTMSKYVEQRRSARLQSKLSSKQSK